MNVITLTPTLSQTGEGAKPEGYKIPSPSGRGTQGEGIHATIFIPLWDLRQFLRVIAVYS